MVAASKKFNLEITRLEQEKEQFIKEKRVLLKKISDKKRKISALRKQLKKAEKTDQKVPFTKRMNSFVSLKAMLFLPVLTVTIVLSLIYVNTVIPFTSLDFISMYHPLAIPFVIFIVSLICIIVSIFYFALYQLIQNSGNKN